MVFPVSQVFNGGQMTDLPEFTGAYDPTALIELVSPGTVEEGVNYAITLELLASFLVAGAANPTIITTGATLGDPYVALETDFRILLNKIVASASYVDIGGGADRVTPIMVRDLKGDADVNNISVSFTGTCDGLASPIVISAPYGGWVFNPLTDGNWYLTNT
jgi:hypothetical protein